MTDFYPEQSRETIFEQFPLHLLYPIGIKGLETASGKFMVLDIYFVCKLEYQLGCRGLLLLVLLRIGDQIWL